MRETDYKTVIVMQTDTRYNEVTGERCVCVCALMERGRKGYKKLAHAIMESGKSHDLSLASWSPRKAGGVALIWA